VPFCAHKCGYCDFASLAGVDHLADRYLDALARELAMRVPVPVEVDTIFVGGGTPTRLAAGQLGRLTATIRQHFVPAAGCEWTVEANPGTLDAEKVEVLAAAGVDRISLGAQSFRPATLAVLERNHDPEDVPRAVELVRGRMPRWSLDLIFGVPGSGLEDWRRDLEGALALGPAHLSCYGLTFEKGTALWKRHLEGEVEPIDEGVERAMFEWTIDRLGAAGLAQYEVSNYARPGEESRHNLAYWRNDGYFGVGLGAARYVGGERAVNTRELGAYLRRLEAGEDPTGPSERLDDEGRARETAVLMLRRVRLGIDRGEFAAATGFGIDGLAGDAIARNVALGNLEDDGARIRLPRSGLCLGDRVMADFL
jgi:oxygen-independent coproporphyrinogen-3 oxidase